MTFCEGCNCGSASHDCSEDSESIKIPEEVAKSFRLFELGILSSGGAVLYRINQSSHVEALLALQDLAPKYIALRLLDFLNEDEHYGDDLIIEAYCIVLSWVAEDLGDDNAPDLDDGIASWFTWAAERSSIELTEILGDDDE